MSKQSRSKASKYKSSNSKSARANAARSKTSRPQPKNNKRRPPQQRGHARATSSTAWTLEAEILPGLADFALQETKNLGISAIQTSDTQLKFETQVATLVKLMPKLRTITAIYRMLEFSISRPKALLGNAEFNVLTDAITDIRRQAEFTTFRIDAAGKDSTVFQRLIHQLETALKLPHSDADGDLLLRVRPSKSRDGWQVLIRTTPRPLSARDWRVCNMAGGLNACVAAVMLELASIKHHHRVLNAMCGSGTLLIEQALKHHPRELWGVDINAEAITCTQQNIAAARIKGVRLEQADATNLSCEDACVDVAVSDLPWGDAIGSITANRHLYPAFLAEMDRVITRRGKLVILTHDVKRTEKELAASAWRVASVNKVFHGGHYPRIYVLRRN
ncbi:MAG: methyltransferase domain-containing protein [Deinococcota bacterium]